MPPPDTRMPSQFETRMPPRVAPSTRLPPATSAKPAPRPASRPKPPAPKVDTSEFAAEGWRFRSATGPISGASELLALARRLADPYTPGDAQSLPFCVHGATHSLKPCVCGSALVMGVRMHLPEAVFGSCSLTLTHEASGLSITFSAEEALRCWARDSVEHGSRALRIPAAQLPAWRERMTAARMKAAVDYDWTYCCDDFHGAVERAAAADAVTTGGRGGGGGGAPAVTALALDLLGSLSPAVRPLATAAGPCGVDGPCPPRAAPTSHAAPPPPRPPPAWSAHRGRGLEADSEAGRLLRSREPILWSADVPLYEDALHDHGAVALRARIRVMPSCFLVLLTHYLRVDGVMVRQRRRHRHHRRHHHQRRPPATTAVIPTLRCASAKCGSSINSGAASCCARERRTRARRAAAPPASPRR